MKSDKKRKELRQPVAQIQEALAPEERFKKFKETETLELKKSTSKLKEGIISIVSILNKHQRGELYFGVRNDGLIVGQDVGEKTIRDVSKAISDHIEPKLFPEITEKSLEGKNCILIKFEGSEIPYFAYGRAYIRVGDEDRQMSAKELEKLFSEKNKTLWERGFSDKKSEDVNKDILKDFVARANKAKRIDFKFGGVESTLKKLNLIEGNRILKAAEVLFCDNNPLEVQAAVFAGTDKLTFLDIKQFKGNLFNLLEHSESYIKEHIDWRAILEDRTREEIPEIPVRAITEAVVNSLCHRDYTNPKGNEIAIFKNRIEIYNPGQFPEGYEPEDFIKGEEKSILRNPLIANTMYLSKDIEKWASGLKRIHDACKEENVRVEFKKLKSGFVIVFYRGGPTVIPQVTPQVTPQDILTGLESKVLGEIIKDPRISRNQISKKLGIGPDTVKEYLGKLKKKGILERKGKTSGGYWKIIGK